MEKFEELTFKLDLNQIDKLTEYTEIKQYFDRVNELRSDFEGLWYEIENVHGNWDFKDRVLPPLFRELHDMLTKHLEEIEKFDSKLFGLNVYEKESRDHKRKLKSLAYLIKIIPNKLQIGTQPSQEFSHGFLEKTLRVLRKRFLVIIDGLIPDIGTQLQIEANNNLRDQICSRLEYKISYYQNRIWDPSTLAHDLTSYEYVNAVKQIFLPGGANTGWHIGLNPLWRSKNGYTAYYFTDNPNKRKERLDELRRIVFIKEKDRPWSEIFEEWGIEQKAWYDNWCSAKDVRSQLVWEFGGRFNCRLKHSLSNKELTEYLQKGLSKLQKLVTHYGKIYSPEEFREYYEDEINLGFEQSLALDEIRNAIRENCMKLFPLNQLQEVLGIELEQVIEVES